MPWVHNQPSPVVPVRALAVLIGCLVGCDQVFELDRGEHCGDGMVSAFEECDDGPSAAGDGCGVTCQIEPGFECPATAPTCLPVVGLARSPISTPLAAVGNPNTGQPFVFDCPPGEVVIGFEGYANQLSDNTGSISAVCGSLGLTPNGDGQLTRSGQSAFFGSQQFGLLRTVMCAPDEVAIGFVPTTNDYLSGFQWGCERVSHTGGVLRFGPSRFLPFEPAVGTQEASQRCSVREAVSGVFGTAGALVDSMGLGCSRISTVLCGDGVQVAPETCDDGNLTPRDGCDARCQRE